MRVVSVMPLYPPATQALTASRKAGTHGAVRSFEVTSRRSACALSGVRSEEHTSELQSQSNLVCRLLLEKKKDSNPVYSIYSSLTRLPISLLVMLDPTLTLSRSINIACDSTSHRS